MQAPPLLFDQLSYAWRRERQDEPEATAPGEPWEEAFPEHPWGMNALWDYRVLREVVNNQKTELARSLNACIGKHDFYKVARASPPAGLSKVQRNRYDQLCDELEVIAKGLGVDAPAPRFDWAPPGSGKAAQKSVKYPYRDDPASKTEGYYQLTERNRELLMLAFPGQIEPRSKVFSYVVLRADQSFRWNLVLVSGSVFLLLGFCIDLNATSMHSFYAERLSAAWSRAIPAFEGGTPLSQLKNAQYGLPYLLVNGSVFLPGRRHKEGKYEPYAEFLFSRLYCGSERTGFLHTDEYMKGKFTLQDAVGISGGAISVLHMRNPLVLALLFLANLRLGQWVNNPGHKPNSFAFLRKVFSLWPVTPFAVLTSLLRTAEHRHDCFVADGGYFDNSGIDALLRRRCRLIIAVDAGADKTGEFPTLTRLIRWARMYHGVVIEPLAEGAEGAWLDELVMHGGGRTDKWVATKNAQDPTWTAEMEQQARRPRALRHYVVARVRYPKPKRLDEPMSGADEESKDQQRDNESPQDAYLLLARSSMTGDEPIELTQFQKLDPNFPNDATADQFYDASRFESYRLLGSHVGGVVARDLGANDPGVSPAEFIERVGRLGTPAN